MEAVPLHVGLHDAVDVMLPVAVLEMVRLPDAVTVAVLLADAPIESVDVGV